MYFNLSNILIHFVLCQYVFIELNAIIILKFLVIISILMKNFFFSKFIWVFIVVASLGVASVFLCTAGYEFINKVVVTTIDTTTASLQVKMVLFRFILQDDYLITFKTFIFVMLYFKQISIMKGIDKKF